MLDVAGATIAAVRGDGAGIHTLDSAHDKAAGRGMVSPFMVILWTVMGGADETPMGGPVSAV
jgi:hypothetical protein